MVPWRSDIVPLTPLGGRYVSPVPLVLPDLVRKVRGVHGAPAEKVRGRGDRGWVTAKFWEAVAGREYDFFLEREYPSLEALASETQARDADYEFMRLMRATYSCVVQGSIIIEIYESVDPGKVS